MSTFARLLPAKLAARETFPGGGAVRFFFIDTSPFVAAYRHWPEMAGEIRSQKPKAQLCWLDQALEGARF